MHVQTKTTVQVRSHAQKYFNRLKRMQGMQPQWCHAWIMQHDVLAHVCYNGVLHVCVAMLNPMLVDDVRFPAGW